MAQAIFEVLEGRNKIAHNHNTITGLIELSYYKLREYASLGLTCLYVRSFRSKDRISWS